VPGRVVVKRVFRLLMFGWTALVAGLVFSEFGGPIQIGLTVAWLALAPGLAIIALLGFSGLLTRLLLSIPLSLCLAAVVSALLVYAGIASWELGMSILVSGTVAALIIDLAPPQVELPIHETTTTHLRGKLAEPSRQAQLVTSLQDGATLAEAADEAGVSVSTLQRGMRRSAVLRRAVEVASTTGLDELDLGADDLTVGIGEFRIGGRRTTPQ
jgi:hypothetical protein